MSNQELNTATNTVQRLTGELSAAQICEIGAENIRTLKSQISVLAANPVNLRELRRLRAVLNARIQTAGLAIQVAGTARDAQMEQAHAALIELNNALISTGNIGIVPEYFGGNPAGQVLGHIEAVADSSVQELRQQSPWVNGAILGTIGIATFYVWTRVRSWSGGALALGATAVAATGAYLGIPWVRDFFDSMAQNVRKRIQQPEKLDQELKKLNEDLENKAKQTNEYYGRFVKLRVAQPPSPGELSVAIASTREAIRIERELLTDGTINRFVASPTRQTRLRERLQRLQVISTELDAADRRSAPPRGTEGGTKTTAQPQVKNDAQRPATVKIDQQIKAQSMPPRSERGPVGADAERAAEKKQYAQDIAKAAAMKKAAMPPIGPPAGGPVEGEDDAPPPIAQPPPLPNPQPTQDIDPATGLPVVPATVPPPVDNNGRPLPTAEPVQPTQMPRETQSFTTEQQLTNALATLNGPNLFLSRPSFMIDGVPVALRDNRIYIDNFPVALGAEQWTGRGVPELEDTSQNWSRRSNNQPYDVAFTSSQRQGESLRFVGNIFIGGFIPWSANATFTIPQMAEAIRGYREGLREVRMIIQKEQTPQQIKRNAPPQYVRVTVRIG